MTTAKIAMVVGALAFGCGGGAAEKGTTGQPVGGGLDIADRDGVGQARSASANSRSILAAQMKSLSDSPSIAWVV